MSKGSAGAVGYSKIAWRIWLNHLHWNVPGTQSRYHGCKWLKPEPIINMNDQAHASGGSCPLANFRVHRHHHAVNEWALLTGTILLPSENN
jgi:hypothetical protein